MQSGLYASLVRLSDAVAIEILYAILAHINANACKLNHFFHCTSGPENISEGSTNHQTTLFFFSRTHIGGPHEPSRINSVCLPNDLRRVAVRTINVNHLQQKDSSFSTSLHKTKSISEPVHPIPVPPIPTGYSPTHIPISHTWPGQTAESKSPLGFAGRSPPRQPMQHRECMRQRYRFAHIEMG